MDDTDGTDSQDMGCVQIKSVESVESVRHEGCCGALKPTDYTDVRRRTGAFAWESVCAGLELSLVNGYVRNVCF